MLTKKGFFCIRCGKCCRYSVTISILERWRIQKRFPGLRFWSPERHWWQSSIRMKDGRCVFLEEKNGLYSCRIFDIRPKICRQYPFFKVSEVKSCFPEDLGTTALKNPKF
ncbi:YkgJ family cysteine cluster protein [Candidatus Woesearchaeota archaeon]|nr:YkgJ family cysteine cluster protein [Candidatus Woesearchaeota archaeon]